jgi:DNA-binding CsgD family transcriptional regulator
MYEYIGLGYIATIIIGVSALMVQITAKGKQLEASSQMMLQNSMTFFLALVLVYNFCDFLSVFLAELLKEEGVQWIYIFENVLEVGFLYALLDVERRMAGSEKPKWLDLAFVIIGMSVLFGDSIHSFADIYTSEFSYAITMFVLNMIPIVIVLVLGLKYLRNFKQREGRRAYINMLLYNFVCVILCVVTTVTIIDQRTKYDFVPDDEIVYIVFWLLFNTVNLVFVWESFFMTPRGSGERNAAKESCTEEIFEKYELSEREREIALYILEGKNNKEIAGEMFLSPNTVKVHASNLYRKLGASNRVQAVRILSGQEINQEETENETAD